MTDSEKYAVIETAFESLLEAIQSDYDDLNSRYSELSVFDQGQHMALQNVIDSINTRLEFVKEVLSDEDVDEEINL